jgi:RNA polymerase sigma-70 factor (ECF subfamily)
MYPTRVAGRTSPVASEATAEAAQAERRAIEAVLAGNRDAFRFLVERHQRGVHAVIYRLVHGAADAEDLAQQAFLAAFDALPQFRLDLKFSSWIYRIAVNLAKDHLKSKQRGELAVGASDGQGAVFAGRVASPDSAAVAAERQRVVERALASLPLADREVLVLKDLEELSYEEMKAILGRPITALKIRVVRARAKLRSAIERLTQGGAL